MRREELFSAFSNLANAFEESGMLRFFEVRPPKTEQRQEKQPNLEGLEVFRRFEAYARDFTAIERSFLRFSICHKSK